MALGEDELASERDLTRQPGLETHARQETIPYETVFLSDRPLTEEEIEYGRRLATELGL